MNEHKKVFYVDDNLTCLIFGKEILKPFYTTFTIPSAKKMFEFLKSIRPDIIILDIEMPDMSGYEAIDLLKSGEYKDIPVIFVSGNEWEEDREEALKHGAADYIIKPFLQSTILDAIGKALR